MSRDDKSSANGGARNAWNWLGVDRSEAAAKVRAKLEEGISHVHVLGAPGFGKREIVEALAQSLALRAVIVRLDQTEFGADPLRLVWNALTAGEPPPGPWPDGDWPTGWDWILRHLQSGDGTRRVLVVLGAEHLFADGALVFWPDGLFDKIDMVTVSLAPLHLIAPAYSQRDAEDRTVQLEVFPPPEEPGYDAAPTGERWNVQNMDEYNNEGGAWLDRYIASREGSADHRTVLRKIFALKHKERRDEFWDGHPLINMVVLEDMLDLSLADGRPTEALARWRKNLSVLGQSALAARLLPFSPGQRGAVTPFVAEAVAESVVQMAKGVELDAVQRQWLLASGLAVPKDDQGRLAWSHAAGLITRESGRMEGDADALAWARRTLLSARQARRAIDQHRHDHDQKFRAAMDQVKAMFCETSAGAEAETRVESAESRVIISDHVYSFRLSCKAGPDRAAMNKEERADPIRPSYDILVFETAHEGLQFWKHHIRILAMLGRMRHPSLVAFARGGILRAKDEAIGENERVYVRIDRVLERLPIHSLNELAAALPNRRRETGPDGRGFKAYRQIVDLAEALELIHAQGIVHRSLDFTSLAIDRSGREPQLVLTDFEFSANLRSEMQKRNVSPLASLRHAAWNLACRPPEVQVGIVDEIDPSIDVYSFGALAIVLATGLPDEDLLLEIDRMLPVQVHARDIAEVGRNGRAIKRAIEQLRDNLLDDARWPVDDDSLQRLRRIVAPCLDEPDKRPTMEDLVPRLQGWHSDNEAARARPEEVLYVSFPEREMGKMLKNLEFIDRDMNLDSPEGRAFLQTRLQGWINSAKWMHFRESGFPRRGSGEAERTQREARYVLAGKNIVFFASVFRHTPSSPPDPTFLWLAYVMRRDFISLPDPDDGDLNHLRSTTEDRKWLPRPANVSVVPRSEINAIENLASWQPTLTELEMRGQLTVNDRLGREAATVWRLHRDIQLAAEAIRSFPVIVEKEHGSEQDLYTLTLDEDAYRRANETGALSFLRTVLIEGKNLRAYFVDTVQGLSEDESAGQIGFVLYPRKARGLANKRRIVGSIILPVKDNKVQMRVIEKDDGPIPSLAQIRWFGSFGTETAIERQTTAIERLERRTWLMDYIVTPRDGHQLARPISPSCGTMLKAQQERIDELRERVRVLISSDPLHAVQGPPGTGKTTLIAALVAEVLAGEDGSRLLVTSQSHAATDNVLLSVVENLRDLAKHEGRDDWLPPTSIRLFSDSTRGSVDSVVRQRHSIDAQVRAALSRMQENASSITDSSDRWLRKAHQHLQRAARGGYLEVRFKIERSSPLVFATTGAAMTSADFLRRGAIGFDYVLIDEAARAFSIDLVQPMALADRVVWVGDQAQLPPFGETDLAVVLETAARRRQNEQVPPDIHYLLDQSCEVGRSESAYARMKGWLKLFHRVFEKCPPSKVSTANSERVPITQALDRQFRSVEAIGRLVADTFYRDIDIKQSGPDPEPTRRVSVRLQKEGTQFSPAVAWIDTSRLTERRYFSRSSGRGRLENAGEADIVKFLLKDFNVQIEEGDDPWERLRVLSPYKAQVSKMQEGFFQNPIQLGVDREKLPRLFQTVDSAQGSEADIVLLSFSRRFELPPFEALRDEKSPADRIRHLRHVINQHLGFLQQPERINVMMSRARQQILLLGDIEYYRRGAKLLDLLSNLEGEERHSTSFWTAMLSAFKPFDPAVHLTPDGTERPVILPAELIPGVNR